MRIYIKFLPPPSADQRRAGSSERSAQPANRTKSLNLGSKKDSSGSCWTSRFLQDYKRQKPKMEPQTCHFKDLSNLPNIVQCWFRFLAGVIINIKGKNKICRLKAPGHWLVSVKLILPSTHKVPFGFFWGNALQSTRCGVIFNYRIG